MGRVFDNPTLNRKRPVTKRQASYLNGRKTDRPRNQKPEQELQLELCQWIRDTLPGIHFRSDTASGSFNSAYEKEIHNRQQSSTSEPDLAILAARRGYHGLMIELKADGESLTMKRDGRKVRVYKDKKGKIIGFDNKIRKKGDWASLHIENQAKCLEDYQHQGFRAAFAVGIEQAKKLICWYFEIEYTPPVENAELF